MLIWNVISLSVKFLFLQEQHVWKHLGRETSWHPIGLTVPLISSYSSKRTVFFPSANMYLKTCYFHHNNIWEFTVRCTHRHGAGGPSHRLLISNKVRTCHHWAQTLSAWGGEHCVALRVAAELTWCFPSFCPCRHLFNQVSMIGPRDKYHSDMCVISLNT